MSEGKLYMKLHDKEGIYYDALDTEQIKAMLDEAKADAPKLQDYAIEGKDVMIEVYNVWLKKWFGRKKP